jgi:hypothetical protein
MKAAATDENMHMKRDDINAQRPNMSKYAYTEQDSTDIVPQQTTSDLEIIPNNNAAIKILMPHSPSFIQRSSQSPNNCPRSPMSPLSTQDNGQLLTSTPQVRKAKGSIDPTLPPQTATADNAQSRAVQSTSVEGGYD